MKVYRSTMEKYVEQQEDSEVITNPKEPIATRWRKFVYKLSLFFDHFRRSKRKEDRG